MSFPYPQDRNRDRREKGGQPYQAARKALARSKEEIQTEAEAFGEARRDMTAEEREAEFVAEMEARLREVGKEIAAQHPETREVGLADEDADEDWGG